MICITGATGLLGGNLAIDLIGKGHKVRCIKRKRSFIGHLSDYPIDWVEGDLGDTESLSSAFSNCVHVINCAGVIGFTHATLKDSTAANILGVENLITAVANTGVDRFIHCSTVDAIGLRSDGIPSDETVPWNWETLGIANNYARTKFQGQKRVIEAARKGIIDAVVVNPGFMIGPNDPKPSSGKLLLNIAQGRAKGYPSGSNNFVDVRDVCTGIANALYSGKNGELYILGGYNLSYKEFFTTVAQIARVDPPKFKIPKSAALCAGYAGDFLSNITGKEFDITSGMVKVSYSDHIYSSLKAETELGYIKGPLSNAIKDALAWQKLIGFRK